MPEGPELHKASLFVNDVCRNRVFTGKILKSAVSTKNPEIVFDVKEYTIRAESRGKEMALILTEYQTYKTGCQKKETLDNAKSMRILFRFGMSGKFLFSPANETHKHAHLQFITTGKPAMALCFVDTRRFGSWQVNDSWSPNRGPDPVFEYKAFRANILENLSSSLFNKPLCEVLHDQRFFNGIGNYLRAEIIYRSGIPPFSCARTILEELRIKQEPGDICEASIKPDVLELCQNVPKEVINLTGAGYDPSGNHSDYKAFCDWLRCYCNPEMNNVVDHDGRTMWFQGDPGKMVPKEARKRHVRKRVRKVKENKDAESEINNEPSAPKKVKLESEAKPEPIKGRKDRNPIKRNKTVKRKSGTRRILVENPGAKRKPSRVKSKNNAKPKGNAEVAKTKRGQKQQNGNAKRSQEKGSNKTSVNRQQRRRVTPREYESVAKTGLRRSSRLKR